jgi:hypothetical protein
MFDQLLTQWMCRPKHEIVQELCNQLQYSKYLEDQIKDLTVRIQKVRKTLNCE